MSSANDEPLAPRALIKAPARIPPGLAPRRQVLEGRFARLEPLDPAAHAAALFEAGHEQTGSERIWAYLPYGPWGDLGAFAEHLRQQSAKLDPVFYAIIDKATGAPSGVASYLEIDPAQGLIEIGHIWLAPSIQRRATGSEALILMMKEAMDGLGNRRLQWKCDAVNEKSRAAARRFGFKFEGVLASVRIVKGVNRDTAYYSILDDEWPPVRAALDDWLESIGQDGVATRRLSELTSGLPVRGEG